MKRKLLISIVLVALVWLFLRLTAVSLVSPSKNANQAVCEVTIDLFYTELDAEKAKFDRYPSEEEGLPAIFCVQGSFKKVPMDPWGNPYRYRLINRKPMIDSAGRDGQFGTGDDIQR